MRPMRRKQRKARRVRVFATCITLPPDLDRARIMAPLRERGILLDASKTEWCG